MDKNSIEDRIKKTTGLREAHIQDVEELGWVIEGLKKQLEEMNKDGK